MLGANGFNLHVGGADRSYYLADTHAIAADGSVYFTAVGTGQLYLRENPTQEQSEVITNGAGEEECTEPSQGLHGPRLGLPRARPPTQPANSPPPSRPPPPTAKRPTSPPRRC